MELFVENVAILELDEYHYKYDYVGKNDGSVCHHILNV
jgi:hypothetical protein